MGSHVVYRHKETGTVNASDVLWRRRGTKKKYLRVYTPCSNLEIFRLLSSVASERKWAVGEMDIKAAYLQARAFERDIYVRSPRKQEAPGGLLCKLTAAAFGLADSGRL